MKVLLLGLCILVSACSMNTPSYAEQLFESKVQYVGDATKVKKIIEKIGMLEEFSTSTLVLVTTDEPYEIQLHLDDVITYKELEDFEEVSLIHHYLLLSLVENADLVSIHYEYINQEGTIHKQVDSLNSNEATLFLGSSVKEFGLTKDQLQSLLDVLEVKIP